MHSLTIGAALVLAGMAACGPSAEPRIDARDARPNDATPWQTTERGTLVSASDTMDYAAFGLDLFRRIATEKADSNVIVSPVSAGLALSMVMNGAEGATREGMARTLALAGMDLDALNASNAALAGALQTDSVELAIANSLWARNGIPFLPDFMERNRRFYGAEVATLDLTSPEAARRINDWASRNTRGRITRMVDPPLDPDLILYLMNAVYFKGRWVDEFEADQTEPMPFHAPGGRVQRPMMRRTGDYGFLERDGFRAVRLPYRGGRFAMYVFLPNQGTTLAAMRDRMTPDAWSDWMTGFESRPVSLTMPKYRMSVGADLEPPLSAMGMAEAFDEVRANFRAMLPAEMLRTQNAFVSEAKQKVFIEVNEEGTEAAAVTGVAIALTSAPPPPVEFVVDRPFVLAIRDDRTGALLFLGQVNDPVTE